MEQADQAGKPGDNAVTAAKHPAKFSPSIKGVLTEMIQAEQWTLHRVARVLDPFAGVGGIHDLPLDLCLVHAIELEPEWAVQSEAKGWTWCGDFFAYPLGAGWYDMIVTSCTYGNRMADHHNAQDPSKRNTYKHTLGRDLTPGNSGAMQWGDEYRVFHRMAWLKVWNMLKPGGAFILNISDHIRKKERQPVTAWHIGVCKSIGFVEEERRDVQTPRNRQGENHEARVAHEWVIRFRKPLA